MRGHYDDERDLNDDDWADRIVGELCGEPVDRSAVNRVKSRIEALRASVRAAKASPRHQVRRANAEIVRHAEANQVLHREVRRRTALVRSGEEVERVPKPGANARI